MSKKDYKQVWLALVNIKSEKGKHFNDLVELDDHPVNVLKYKGAWANVLVKAKTIQEAIEIVHLGLKEKSFEVKFFDKIENSAILVEKKELEEDVLQEIIWLLESDYVFMISDRIFPYV